MIFFISDRTEHPNFLKTPMFNLTWAESHIQSSCASRVQWNSQNFSKKADPVKILPDFLKTPMKSEKKCPWRGRPAQLIPALPSPSVQDTLPKFVNSDGFRASQNNLLKRTETQDLTNNVIRYRVTNKDTLHALYYHIMPRLKDSVWTNAFITVVYCA